MTWLILTTIFVVGLETWFLEKCKHSILTKSSQIYASNWTILDFVSIIEIVIQPYHTTTMFKRNPSLTEQVKAHLKQRIINDEFEAGRIPSETELATNLGVSRTTIRDALSRLELEGVVYRKQGAGTFINEAGLQIKTRLEEIWGYEDMLRDHGYRPSTQILSVETRPAQLALAKALRLKTGEPLVEIKKLFLGDDRPVVLTVNYLPARLIRQAYSPDDFHAPIYEFLLTHCEQNLAYYFSEIVPLIAPEWLLDPLRLPQPRALIAFEEIGYNQDNEPILKASSYFRDDLVRFRLIRRDGTRRTQF